MMRALGNSARAGIIILGLYLMGLLVDAPRWDASMVEITSPTARFADVLMVDWSLALVVLGALLSMAMIGASYLVRDERLENLVWNESEIEVAPAPSKRSFSPRTMDKVSGNELALLANYLAEKGQTVFQFFRSIDLDDSGEVDTMEFQIALSKAEIANLPPWDIDALVSQMDLNGDGKLDLPELDIALLSIGAAKPEEEAEEEPEVAEDDAEIEVEAQHEQAEEEAAEDQARMDKELEERRKRLENLDEKARKREEELIRVAEKRKTIDFGTLGVASASEADDLQEIKGIGPFIAEKLNALGIYKFSQLANMTSEIEEEVNVAIEFFPGRIKRDEWAKQARNIVGGEEE
ncbi:MAG: EF-hand domain-containing protein [Candidatus Thermoplasmatota archaeon]|nr:EF-hand domain-containing protein [Candidatus Thermoplasmatota archaeon]